MPTKNTQVSKPTKKNVHMHNKKKKKNGEKKTNKQKKQQRQGVLNKPDIR